MGELRGGHIVAKYLKENEGIDTVFSLSGGHIMPIYDGCMEYGVGIVDVRHEQAAPMMAHAWSIYKGKPGVCLVTAGPGFTNSLTGVANAFLENVPMVVLSGMCALPDIDKGALQDMNQADMIKPVVKWAGRCRETKRIPEYLESAFRYAVAGRPGPTFLEIPPDALYLSEEEERVAFPVKGSRKYTVVPDEESLEKAAELINGSERPVLLGGSGICHSECGDEVKAFVEKTGIPTLLMNNGRGTLSDDDPLSLWDGGLTGMLAAMSMADVVISAGIRLNWVLSYGQPMADARLIRIDIDPAEVDRNQPADVALVGDAGSVLGQLRGKVEAKDRGEWLGTLRSTFRSLTEAEEKQKETASDPIHPVRLVHLLRQAVGDDPINIVDGGDTVYFGLTGLRAKERAGVIGSGLLFGCLGTGVPFAIGAQVARPEERVVLLSGDGAFGFNTLEFETAARHCLPIVAVICNDQAWGMVKHGHRLATGAEGVCGTDLGIIHYERIVEALGGHGEFVTRDEEIVPAIERAMDSGKPACVNVITDPTVTSPATMMFAQGFDF